MLRSRVQIPFAAIVRQRASPVPVHGRNKFAGCKDNGTRQVRASSRVLWCQKRQLTHIAAWAAVATAASAAEEARAAVAVAEAAAASEPTT